MSKTMIDKIDRMLLQWVACDLGDTEKRLGRKHEAMNWVYSHDMPVAIRDDIDAVLSYVEELQGCNSEVFRIRSWMSKMDTIWSESDV